MHEFVDQDREVLGDIASWVDRRLSAGPVLATRPPGTGHPALPEVTAGGIGLRAAWECLRESVLPAAFPTDHPRYLAFVGGAPTPAAVLADAVLTAASIYGGSQLEAGAVVSAERAALAWLCRIVGYSDEAHGAFVSGGSMANLSALVAARHGRTTSAGRPPGVVVAGASAHPSIRAAAAIMGSEVVLAGAPDAPLRSEQLDPVLDELDREEVFAVVATAGATNTGAVDALAEIAASCAARGIWLHVDAAYGGAAMLAAAYRQRFAGIEQADSVTIDPHKWLFTPFDCGAVLYRDPAHALAAHRQHADYLDPVHDHGVDNPADYAVHLTRRARGLPLWVSLLAHGTDAYVDAVEQCLAVAAHAVKHIEASPLLELATGPELSVVLFRRLGWDADDYERWSRQARASGLGLVVPTRYRGESVLRLCFVNPRTTTTDVDMLFDSLQGGPGR